MNPRVIEAATYSYGRCDTPTNTARRVLRAQAGCVSDEAVDAALDAWYPGEDWRKIFGQSNTAQHVRRDMRAAIAAALLKETEGK